MRRRARTWWDGDAESALQGVDGAHLVGDGADATDAGGDVDLPEVAADEEGFKKPWQLRDFEFEVEDAAATGFEEEGAFALDASQDGDLDFVDGGAGGCHWGWTSSLTFRNCQAQAL